LTSAWSDGAARYHGKGSVIGARLRILTYHRIGPPRQGEFEKLTVPPARFARQVGLLDRLGYGFCGLDMDMVPAFVAGQSVSSHRPVIVTFDDGFAELYDHALPVIAERGIPAVVYAASDRRTADWVDWDGQTAPPLLAGSQLNEMAASGITIGSHTRTHRRLTQCSPAELRDEVEGSKKSLEDLLGREVRHFCYPFGAHNDTVVEAVRSAGYVTACTTKKGAVAVGADALRLPRLTVGKRMGFLHFFRRVVLAW